MSTHSTRNATTNHRRLTTVDLETWPNTEQTVNKCDGATGAPCHGHNLCEVADADIDDDADGAAL